MLGSSLDPVQIVGRDSEVNAICEFVAADRSRRTLVLSGEAGIGKTTLWEAGVRGARERGIRVLSSRASGAEARLSFAALIDLLDGIDEGVLGALPAPQRRALEVALLRAEPARASPEPQVIALGFLNVLRALAAREPVLVAIDDVHWLDSPSAEVLAFAAPRLEGHAVGLLLAKRPGRPSSLERALEPSVQRIEVGLLSVGAIRRLLLDQLGLTLPRHLLRRVVESSLGNPLFALEIGRALVEHGLPPVGEDLPVPDAIEDLLGTRVARLSAQVRRLLLAVALSADPRWFELAALVDPAALDTAVDDGLLLVDGDRVRAAHPLLAAVTRKRSRTRARRELHLELAGVVADEALRARHLALATGRPDATVAAVVEAAAAGASARGARQEAVELSGHALRLTPARSEQWSERLLALAAYLVLAGEPQRATDLLAPEVGSLPAGAARARAWIVLAGGAVGSSDEIERYFGNALAESLDDPGLHASVLARMARHTVVIRVARIGDAEAWALEALPAARRAGPDVEQLALYALGWARSLRGHPIDDQCERFRAISDATVSLTSSPERVAGLRLVWRGDVDRGRAVLTRLLSLADDRAEPYSYALLRLHLCQLELRIGAWERAARLLDEWAVERDLLTWPMYERCRALLAAGRGLPAEAEQWAAETIARAEATGNRWDLLEALRARGLAALLAHEPARAAESLREVWDHAQREGVDELGAFPVAPDLVEALVESGELDDARGVTARLGELAQRQEHPWGLAAAKQCDALVRLANGWDDDEAVALLEQATSDHQELGLRFDRARALLLVGRVQRRRRKWAAARRALEQAASEFDEIGSTGWLDETRSELARVGARRPGGTGQLTPTEQRVVALAVEGLSNKEIARNLFVTVNTVEVHLSHAYAKLGVHSRTQLARLAPQG